MQQVVRSSRRAAAEHGASTSAEPAIWGRQAARQRSGWGQQDNAHGELATQTAEVDATPLLDIAYHTTSDPRDALGRITKKTEWLDGTTTTWTYTYDSLNRLYVVTKNGQPFATYTYDLNGNRLTVDGTTTIATHDDQDRLLSYDGTTYTYGQNGELKTRTDGTDTTTYTYDALNNLRQVILPNADTIEYLVDGLGRRVGKKKNGTLVKRWLFKDQLEPIAEIDEPSGNVRRFIYASRAHAPDLMIDHSGVAYRLLTDQLGSVRLVVRVDNGNVVQHIDYDPWGVPTVVTGDWTVQSFGFAGGVYDGETALVRFGARDYDARVGRWTGKDPVRWYGRQANLYEYVAGVPTHFVDPTGWRGIHFGVGGGFGSTIFSWLGLVVSGLPWPSGLDVSGGVYLDWTPGIGWSGGFYGSGGVNQGLGHFAGASAECGYIVDGSKFAGSSHSVVAGGNKKLIRGAFSSSGNVTTLSLGPGAGVFVGTKEQMTGVWP